MTLPPQAAALVARAAPGEVALHCVPADLDRHARYQDGYTVVTEQSILSVADGQVTRYPRRTGDRFAAHVMTGSGMLLAMRAANGGTGDHGETRVVAWFSRRHATAYLRLAAALGAPRAAAEAERNGPVRGRHQRGSDRRLCPGLGRGAAARPARCTAAPHVFPAPAARGHPVCPGIVRRRQSPHPGDPATDAHADRRLAGAAHHRAGPGGAAAQRHDRGVRAARRRRDSAQPQRGAAQLAAGVRPQKRGLRQRARHVATLHRRQAAGRRDQPGGHRHHQRAPLPGKLGYRRRQPATAVRPAVHRRLQPELAAGPADGGHHPARPAARRDRVAPGALDGAHPSSPA